MMRAGLLLAVCLVPTVFGHRNTHAAESVRLLKANETVHASGSDVVFSWEKCVICDGYEARLNLQDISGTRVIPHILKSAVTSLKITDLPPRTVYKLVVKRLPSDVSSSTVSGRTFSPEAPRPVEDLVARVLTNSSIQLEWSSRNADGFMARILEKNTTVQERVFPDFSNHSIVNITNLKPDTDYRVEVTAFYFPPAGNSISPLASARVKTLPVALPDMQLTWKFDSDLELFWKNPDSPSPVKHELQCSAGPSLLKARFDGNTGFVAVPAIFDFDAIDCVLETWFSVDQRSKVVSRVTAVKRKKEQIDQTLPDRFNCPGYGSRHVSTSVGFKVEQINGMELLRLTFSKSNDDNNLAFIEAQYRLCERDGFCDDHWTPVPQTDYPKLLLQQGDLKAWTPYIVQGRFRFRCPYSSSIERDTTPRYLEIPALIGPVVPVTEITATTSMVSWKYNRSSSSPDYFLVTYCTGSDCSSQSVPGDQRSVSLGQLKESSVYYVTIQAVQLRDDRAYVSPTEMTSIVAPKAEASGNVTLKFTEIANSSTVTLLIGQNSSANGPPVVEYHIDICRTSLPIWNDVPLAFLLSSNRTCESMVSTNSSVDLVRLPWTSYEVSVIVCYGAFDSNQPANLTLPIYEQNPSPLAGLTWSQSDSRLSWEYDSQFPSGFSISICPSRDDAPDMCSDILAGPLDRQYHVDSSDLIDSGFIAFVTPFVTYEGRIFNGPKSELAVNASATLPPPPQPANFLIRNARNKDVLRKSDHSNTRQEEGLIE